ncbi:MAG: GtrA family protein [Caldicoprobacterales bacterium]|jgi:putative flippase GtrA|nr:GtrA family protein [Clostridiales bacterium]
MKKRIEIQLVKFGLVGLLNTAIDLGVFTLLTAAVRLDSVISHVISYSCGVINSYYWNRTWTFQKKGKFHPAEFLKFVLVNLVSLGASALVLYYLETGAGMHVYLSKLGAVFCSLLVNFAGSKLIVFRDQ